VIDRHALMAESSWVRGSTGERSVRIREIEGSIPSVFTTWVHGSTGERLHGMREIEGSIPSGSTNDLGYVAQRESARFASERLRVRAPSYPRIVRPFWQAEAVNIRVSRSCDGKLRELHRSKCQQSFQ